MNQLMISPVIAVIDGPALWAIVPFIVLASVFANRGRGGSPLVLKSWYASNTPLADGSFICITGRRSGLMGWILAVIGIDPVTTLKVSATRVEFHASSITGTAHRITPLTSVSSTYFGFHKPIARAIAAGIFCFFIFAALISFFLGMTALAPVVAILGGGLLGFAVALLYLYFNKTQTIGFIEVSGDICEIQFKPSVIEGVNVDEKQAKYAAELMQHLIQTRLDR
jgi:hypothetical protein